MWTKILFSFLFLNLAISDPMPTPPANQYDVIVIGCGVSGLAATAELGRNGKRVLCLEAADRIGGRVRTVPFGDGLVEMGAEWIHGTEGSRTYELGITNNVTIKSQPYSVDHFRSNIGRVDEYTNKALTKLMEYALEVLSKPEGDEGMGDLILRKMNGYAKVHYPEIYQNQTLMNEMYLLFNEIINSYEATNDWNDPSSNSTSKQLGGDQEMSWGRYGYHTLFDIILNKYNGGDGIPSAEILLNTEVTNITWGNELVTVTTRNLTTYVTPRVIVTLSVGVLKERHLELFTPNLPEEKQKAIKAIPMGSVVKIITAYDSVWWTNDACYFFLWRKEDKDKIKEEDKWMTRVALVSKSMGSDNTLEFWVMGHTAEKIESLPLETVKEKITEILQIFMRKEFDIPAPSHIIKSSWLSSPWTRGGYTYDPIDLPSGTRDHLAEPVKDNQGNIRLQFAGEATNTVHYATVHGAYETGVREARRILQEEEDDD